MAKDNNEFYRQVVESLQEKKSKVVGFNDGYRIEFKPLDLDKNELQELEEEGIMGYNK